MNTQERVSSVISTKGQVVVPKSIRARRNWGPGTKLDFEETPDGVLIKQQSPFPRTRIEDVAGSLRYNGPSLSDADIEAALVLEARRRARD